MHIVFFVAHSQGFVRHSKTLRFVGLRETTIDLVSLVIFLAFSFLFFSHHDFSFFLFFLFFFFSFHARSSDFFYRSIAKPVIKIARLIESTRILINRSTPQRATLFAGHGDHTGSVHACFNLIMTAKIQQLCTTCKTLITATCVRTCRMYVWNVHRNVLEPNPLLRLLVSTLPNVFCLLFRQ